MAQLEHAEVMQGIPTLAGCWDYAEADLVSTLSKCVATYSQSNSVCHLPHSHRSLEATHSAGS